MIFKSIGVHEFANKLDEYPERAQIVLSRKHHSEAYDLQKEGLYDHCWFVAYFDDEPGIVYVVS